MIAETEAYKGRKFTCDNCDYVVSSDAMSDFGVEDFNYCPYCGAVQEERMKENSIYKYIETHDKDNDVCKRIDNYMGDKKMLTSSDMDKLLEDAEDVICSYRALLYEILKDVSIGQFVKR